MTRIRKLLLIIAVASVAFAGTRIAVRFAARHALRQFERDSIAKITRLAADRNWVASEIAAIQSGKEGPLGWIREHFALLQNGDWVIAFNRPQRDDWLFDDVFIGRGSDGKWYCADALSSIRFSVLRVTSQPADLKTFVAHHGLATFEPGPDGRSGPKRRSPDDLIFRSRGMSDSFYLHLRDGGAYSLWVRMHLLTAEFDFGTWARQADGSFLLTSKWDWREPKVSHLTVLDYRSLSVLVSPDFDFVKIRAASVEEAKRAIDELKPGTRGGLFVAGDVETTLREIGTPQPFIFYPAMNARSGSHPIYVRPRFY